MSPHPYLWTPPPIVTVPVRGSAQMLPVHRLFFVGRNYHAHALEMGAPRDKATDRPFYFTKSPRALILSGTTANYPPETDNYHHEIELVLAIGTAGFRIAPERAHEHIYGYACGLDMTRRDLQQQAKDKSRPWSLAKDVEQSAVISDIVPMPGQVLSSGAIELSVNGQLRQSANIEQMIWDIREIIADLSLFYHLEPGDLIYTGTPEGVGPVLPGDQLSGRVEGVGEIALTLGPSA